MGAVEGGIRRVHEDGGEVYRDEGRKVQITALTGGRYLGKDENV